MAHPALEGIVGHLRGEPSRTASLVVTLYGDAIAPRGGSVWLGTLLAFFRELGVGEGAVRTAMSRLAADGWLERTRLGRNSFYRLAECGRSTFAAATEHIYNPPALSWDGCFTLILPGPGSHRDTTRTALAAAGFGSPLPGLFVAAAGAAVPDSLEGALRLVTEPDPEAARRLAATTWPLDGMAVAYGRFIETFGPLRPDVAAGSGLADADAFVARILMIHAYRRVILRDPLLPRALLPDGWPGHAARELCAALYEVLLPGSENWLDLHGVSEMGPLPLAGPELQRRFR